MIIMQTAAQNPLVVITGAGGNIGKTLALALRKHYRVIGLDRSGGSSTEGNYDIDLSSFQSVQSTFEKIAQNEGKDIAAVVHLAAYFDFTGEASPLYQTVNVEGTRHLLQVLQGFNVERFIYS